MGDGGFVLSLEPCNKAPESQDELVPRKPEAVREAESYIRWYGTFLGVSGTFVTIWYWLAAVGVGTPLVSLSWLVLLLIGGYKSTSIFIEVSNSLPEPVCGA